MRRPQDAPSVVPLASMGSAEKDFGLLVQALEGELTREPTAERATRLHLEIGRLEEYLGKNLARAESHYRRGIERTPGHRGSSRSARRVLLAQRKYDDAIAVLDQELGSEKNPRKRADLLYEKSLILADALGRHGEATAILRAAIADAPGDLSLLDAGARLFVHEKHWDAAEEHLFRMGSSSAGDARIRAGWMTERARLFARDPERRASAMEALETAVLLHPAPSAVETLKGWLRSDGRDVELAHLLAKRCAQTSDRAHRAALHYELAHVYTRLGEPDKAHEQLKHATTVAPEEELFREAFLCASEQGRDFAALAETLSDAATTAPNNPESASFAYQAGVLYEHRLFQDERATQVYRLALAIDPSFRPAFLALVGIFTRSENFRQLAALYEEYLPRVHDPRQRALLHEKLADLYENQLGDRAHTEAHLEAALALDPTLPRAFVALSRLYLTSKRFQACAELYERAADRTPSIEDKCALLTEVASIYEHRVGDLHAAKHAYTRASDLGPTRTCAFRAIWRVSEGLGQHKELVKALWEDAKTAKDPVLASALYAWAGDVLAERMDDPEGAADRYGEAARRDPKNRYAAWGFRNLAIAEEKWRAFVDAVERDLKMDLPAEDAVRMLLEAATVLEHRLEEPDEALGCLRRAYGIDPTPFAPHVQAFLRLLHLRGQSEEHVRVLEECIPRTSAPRARATLWLRAGETYEYLLAQPERAAHAYRQALSENPTRPAAFTALARVAHDRANAHDRIADLEQVAAAAPDGSTRAVALSEAARQCGDGVEDKVQALSLLERAHRADPTDACILLAWKGRAEDASAWNSLRKALHALHGQASDPAVRTMFLRGLFWATSMIERARAEQSSVHNYSSLVSFADDPVVLFLAEAHAVSMHDPGEIRWVDEAIAATETDPVVRAAAYARLGLALEFADNPAASAAYRAAIESDPDSIIATRGLSRIAIRGTDTGEITDAAERELRTTRDFRATARLMRQCAELRIQSGDNAGALADLEHALELAPDDAEIARALMAHHAKHGDRERLAQQLARAASSAKKAERASDLWMKVSNAYAQLENPTAALRALQRALRADPNNLLCLQNLIATYMRDERWSEAANLLTRVTEVATEPSWRLDAFFELAKVWHERLGDPQQAQLALQSLLAIDPKNEKALELRKHIASEKRPTATDFA